MIFCQLSPCINYRILAFYATIPVKIHGNSIIPLYHIQGNFVYRGILLYNVRIVHWGQILSVLCQTMLKGYIAPQCFLKRCN